MWEIQRHGYGASGPESGGPLWPLWPDLFTEDGLNDSHSAGEFGAQNQVIKQNIWVDFSLQTHSAHSYSFNLMNTAFAPLVETPTAQARLLERVLHDAILSSSFHICHKRCEVLHFLSVPFVARQQQNPIQSQHTGLMHSLVFFY